MPDLTVPVPDEQVAEFYQFFGLFLAGALSLTPGPAEGGQTSTEASKPSEPVETTPWGDDEESADDAEFLWKKFSPNARNMFGLLMDNPGKRYTGDQIAAEVTIPHAAHGVAGVLAWPGRFCAPLGRSLPCTSEEDAVSGMSDYWMEPNVADLFKAARDKVENG